MTGRGRNRSVHNLNVIKGKHHKVFAELGRRHLTFTLIVIFQLFAVFIRETSLILFLTCIELEEVATDPYLEVV